MATAQHHLVFGNGRRDMSDADGLIIPICDNCHTIGKNAIHDNPVAEKLSKMLGQAIWERNCLASNAALEAARKEFMRRYGKSWL